MGKEEMDKTAWERSGAVDQAMLLLCMDQFSHLHALRGNSSIYRLENDSCGETTGGRTASVY